MTPKEKAKELVEKFNDYVNPCMGSGMLSNHHDDGAIRYQSKRCAIIAVDEILEEFKNYPLPYGQEENFKLHYWQKVKESIESL